MPHILAIKGVCVASFMEREGIRERLASAASMPKDVVMGAAVTTVLGNT